MRTIDQILSTGGNGLWSTEARDVRVIGLAVPYNEENKHGELRVYFDIATWDTEKHGLIYTDKKFLAEMCEFLDRAGYDSRINYSEAGMQGDDYVSFDVGADFLNSWTNRH